MPSIFLASFLFFVPWVPSFVEGKSMSSGCKVLDLTHELSDKTPYYPVYKPFNLTHSFAGRFGPEVDYVEYNFICSYEHMGTHIDAPSHFSEGGVRIDKVPLETLIGEACMIDISGKVRKNRDYLLTISDVEEWEAENGLLDSDSVVLLYTGQLHLYWNMKDYFGATNASDPKTYHFSAFSGEVAKFLVEERNVKSVGVDCISLDGALDASFPAHVNFLHHGSKASPTNYVTFTGKLASLVRAREEISDGRAMATVRFALRSHSPTIRNFLPGSYERSELSRAFAFGWNGLADPCRRSNMQKLVAAAGSNGLVSSFAGLLMAYIACFVL